MVHSETVKLTCHAKKSDTVLIDGLKVHYNYAKKHIDLSKLTPMETSNIKVKGLNKWHILIQNASLYTYG